MNQSKYVAIALVFCIAASGIVLFAEDYDADDEPRTYTVTFDVTSNRGILDGDRTKTVTYGSAYGELPSAYKEGCTFAGWFTSAKGGERIVPQSIVSITKNTTLYAQFVGNVYTVTFNSNTSGGTITGLSTKNVTYGLVYGDLPTASRSGYNFEGWYTGPNSGQKITSGTIYTVAGDQTLYAHWSLIVEGGGTTSLDKITEIIGDSFFNGNNDLAGIVVFILAILGVLGFTQNMFYAMITGMGVTMFFTVFGILSMPISVLILIVCILGLARARRS